MSRLKTSSALQSRKWQLIGMITAAHYAAIHGAYMPDKTGGSLHPDGLGGTEGVVHALNEKIDKAI